MIMVKAQETNGCNDHYGTRHHKYTINLPIGLIRQAQVKCKEAGFLELAPYFRAILSKEVSDGKLILSDILGQKEFKRQEYLKKENEEQRREIEFVKVPIKNFLAKMRNIMYAFNRRRNQQYFEF